MDENLGSEIESFWSSRSRRVWVKCSELAWVVGYRAFEYTRWELTVESLTSLSRLMAGSCCLCGRIFGIMPVGELIIGGF